MTDRDALAQRHMGLVHALCRRFANKGIEYEELFAAGCLGLTKALNGFDKSRGMQFSTYAFPVIAGEIKRLFRDGGTVKVSRSLRELSLKIARLNSESVKAQGEELSVSELARRLNVSREKIVEAIGSAQVPLSLTAGADGDEGLQLDLPSP
ncbi:MAG: sigma-70 family RNA polymerase sigma factor, partial [Ruminococcus sp.]|nr:sigma-70 family RNA polymerase sigma factor [Ruminococcus sp.]